MSYSPEFDSAPEEHPASVTLLSLDGRELVLLHANTVFRKFNLEGGEYDYVVHETPDGSTVGIPVDEDMRESMELLEFPAEEHQELDEEAIDFYVASQAQNIDADLADLT